MNCDGIEACSDDLITALHFEFCPGGYDGSMILSSDIGDQDAEIHFIQIKAGFPGAPAKPVASYDPSDVAIALRHFFYLQRYERPLFYNGGMCFKVKSLEDFTAALAEAFCPEDEDDDEGSNELYRNNLIALCNGSLKWEDYEDA